MNINIKSNELCNELAQLITQKIQAAEIGIGQITLVELEEWQNHLYWKVFRQKTGEKKNGKVKQFYITAKASSKKNDLDQPFFRCKSKCGESSLSNKRKGKSINEISLGKKAKRHRLGKNFFNF